MPFSYQSTVKGAVPIAGSLVNPSGVAVVDFAIPAGVRRLTLLSNGLVTTGALVRLGTSSGVLTTGYNSVSNYYGGSNFAGNAGFNTVAIVVPKCGVQSNAVFCMTFYRISPNNWNASGIGGDTPEFTVTSISNIALPGELTTFRYINPTTMTSGSLQLLWEF